ncbi:MAG: M10 family metallopeptidase C-terminal domain-containing protein [Paracoccaceae bacterium]
MCQICATFRPGDPACPYDGGGPRVFEGSDAPASPATPYGIVPGGSFAGTLERAGDRDFLRVDLQAGQVYEFRLLGSGGDDGLDDPYLRLHAADGRVLDQNDDHGIGRDARLLVAPRQDGAHYLSAGAYSDAGAGDYVLLSRDWPPPAAPADQIAGFLTDGYWCNTLGRHGFDSGEITVNLSALAPDAQALARRALEAWAAVADLDFAEVPGEAQITYTDAETGAFTRTAVADGRTTSATVNIGANWVESYGGTLDSYGFFTFLHETGHALGLGHPGDYEGFALYGRDEVFANDSWQLTAMSYFDQQENAEIAASLASPVTPMLADMLAIQSLYGAASAGSATAGDTTYGRGTGLPGHLGEVFAAFGIDLPADTKGPGALALTIWDAGGTDRIDLGFGAFDDRLDLAPGSHSDVAGLKGNLGIAQGTVIEHARGGAGNDTISGNQADNDLQGQSGNDILHGLSGDDRLFGEAGNDRAFGGAGDDILFGGPGIDTLKGAGGDDRLVGGPGNDFLFGQAGDDFIFAGNSHDRLHGAGGNDTMIGGNGRDIAWMGAGDDLFIDNDQTGRNAHDRVLAGGGDDEIRLGGGNDTATGGDGADTFVFARGFQHDRITDFTPGEDRLELDMALWRGFTPALAPDPGAVIAATARAEAGGTVLDFGHGDALRLDGVSDIATLAGDLLLA